MNTDVASDEATGGHAGMAAHPLQWNRPADPWVRMAPECLLPAGWGGR